jgi:hypothetical protein
MLQIKIVNTELLDWKTSCEIVNKEIKQLTGKHNNVVDVVYIPEGYFMIKYIKK